MTVSALVAANAARWTKAQVTRSGFDTVAKRLLGNKARYQEVEKATGVPWFVIAVIHEREASGNFNTQLGQGDPLHEVSRHVPRGRGPFQTWEDGAIDALVNCGPYAAKWKDWSPGGALTLLEEYNGLGYANRGVPSPYIWSGTDQYKKGKYVADGVYNAAVVDSQLGCAGMIKGLMALDSTIEFGAPAHPVNEHPAAPAKTVPAAPAPAPATPPAPKKSPIEGVASVLEMIFNFIRELLVKKD